MLMIHRCKLNLLGAAVHPEMMAKKNGGPVAWIYQRLAHRPPSKNALQAPSRGKKRSPCTLSWRKGKPVRPRGADSINRLFRWCQPYTRVSSLFFVLPEHEQATMDRLCGLLTKIQDLYEQCGHGESVLFVLPEIAPEVPAQPLRLPTAAVTESEAMAVNAAPPTPEAMPPTTAAAPTGAEEANTAARGSPSVSVPRVARRYVAVTGKELKCDHCDYSTKRPHHMAR
ncbi:hypothetical protein BIW11_10606, partial [Tropilaelaps mercedesae]